jgi:Co/Zn/Cd efflux system component
MAMCIARWKPTESNTFGWRRFEVFGALISVLIVWLLVIALVYEAVLRVNVRMATRLSRKMRNCQPGPE